MNGDRPVDFVGGMATMGRTVAGRYSIRVNGRKAGSESWQLSRTALGVEARSRLEIAHPLQVRYALLLELDEGWHPRRLQVSMKTPDQVRDGEYHLEPAGWRGQVVQAGGGEKEFSGELTDDAVFDFGASVIHFNTMWMDQEPGTEADVEAVLIQPDLTPRAVRQSFRFLGRIGIEHSDDENVEAVHQSVTTDGPAGIVINHYWTLPNGVPLRSLIVARQILFELVLVEYEGPRGASSVSMD